MEVIDETRIAVEAHERRLGVWLKKQFRKFSSVDSMRAQEYTWDTKETVSGNFIKFLKQLSELMNVCDKDDS